MFYTQSLIEIITVCLILNVIDLLIILVFESCYFFSGVFNTFRPRGVYILRGLPSHQSGAL
jgi:hypothetical protein